MCRGGIVDEDALDALERGVITSAALDVFEIEPLPANYKLVQHEISMALPIGAATLEAQHRVGLDIAEAVNLALKVRNLRLWSIQVSQLILLAKMK